MDAVGLLAWLVIGGIAGWTATFLIPSGLGLFSNITAGIIGGLIGGFLFNQVGSAGLTGFNIWSIFVAFIGAFLLLIVTRLAHSQIKTHISKRNNEAVDVQF